MILCHGCACRESCPRLWPAGLSSRPSGRDDHRSCACVRILVITRVAAGLRLSRREEMWNTAEILILRHQISVLQRRQPRRPKLDWADRVLLAALLGVIPKARRRGLRLLVTRDTILRWHRDIVRRRRAARSAHGKTGPAGNSAEHQGPGPSAGPREPGWGYRRIHGEMAGRGASVAAPAVWEILKASGIGPARQSGPNWPQFLRSQAEAILAWASSRPACRWHPGLRPGRDRACDPAHPHPRGHPCIPPGSGLLSRHATS